MKKTLMILVCLSMSYSLMAQETVKQKEIGLVFSYLDNFGLTFKTGTNKSLWRFTTLVVNGFNTDNSTDMIVNKQTNTGFSGKVGKEYRKNIAENFELRLGADLSFAYYQSKLDYADKTITNNIERLSERITYSPGVNLVFGLNYKLGSNFVIGAELLPNFSYTTGKQMDKTRLPNNSNEVESNISGFNYGLSNKSVLLSLSYRF